MAMNFEYPVGATPLDPDEAAGLIPRHIVNHGQLNEWELVNIVLNFVMHQVHPLKNAFNMHKPMRPIKQSIIYKNGK